MNKASATQRTGGEPAQVKVRDKAVGETKQADVQRLRALVNLLNMRIELLEAELANCRKPSGSDDDR